MEASLQSCSNNYTSAAEGNRRGECSESYRRGDAEKSAHVGTDEIQGQQTERVAESMPPTQHDKNTKLFAKRTICTQDDFRILLEYLEVPATFDRLFGGGRKKAVGGKYTSKEAMWDRAAAELKVLGFPQTTGKNLQKKWQRYFSKYKEAKKISKQSGGGLTSEDVQRGITLDQKLNGICNHFQKMDDLLGAKVNVSPPAQSGPMGFEDFAPHPTPATQEQEPKNISTPSSPVRVAPPEATATAVPPKTSTRTDQDSRKSSFPSKPPFASVYQESKAQEAEMRFQYVDKKHHWKMAELKERHEARLDEVKRRRLECEFQAAERRAEREFQAAEKRMDREETFLEAQRVRLHKFDIAKRKNRLDLIIAGWSHGKSQEEITAMIEFLEK